MVSQTEFTTEWLSGKLNEPMLNIELLNAASARSLSLARPDADLRLCRYALSLIKSDSSAGRRKSNDAKPCRTAAYCAPSGGCTLSALAALA